MVRSSTELLVFFFNSYFGPLFISLPASVRVNCVLPVVNAVGEILYVLIVHNRPSLIVSVLFYI